MSICPPKYLAGATRDLAERITRIHAELIEFAMQAHSIDRMSVSLNLTIAAREVAAAKTKLAMDTGMPVEHTRS